MTPLDHDEQGKLRSALQLMGGEIEREYTQHAPFTGFPVRGARGKRALVLLGGMAAAAAAATWFLALQPSEKPNEDASTGGLTRYEAIACSQLVAVVDVRRIETVQGSDRARVTMDVVEWVKPSGGARSVTVEMANPDTGWGDTILTEGIRALVRIPTQEDLPPTAFTEEISHQVRQIRQDMPTAKRTVCPPEWR